MHPPQLTTAFLDAYAGRTCARIRLSLLNPIRATVATCPETSDLTSVEERIRARDALLREKAFLKQADTATLVPSLHAHAESIRATEADGSLWIAPIASGTAHKDSSFTLTLDDYLTLVDHTGRIVRTDKRGVISAHLAPILERLNLDLTAWLDLRHSGGLFMAEHSAPLPPGRTAASRPGIVSPGRGRRLTRT